MLRRRRDQGEVAAVVERGGKGERRHRLRPVGAEEVHLAVASPADRDQTGVGEGRLDGAWAPAAMALALGAPAPVAESAAAPGRAGSLRTAARVRAALGAPVGAPAPANPLPAPAGPLGLRLRGIRFGYGSAPS